MSAWKRRMSSSLKIRGFWSGEAVTWLSRSSRWSVRQVEQGGSIGHEQLLEELRARSYPTQCIDEQAVVGRLSQDVRVWEVGAPHDSLRCVGDEASGQDGGVVERRSR